MNLAKLRQRMEQMRERYQRLRPKQPARPLVISFCSEVNRLAPSGTRAEPDGEYPLPEELRSFAMIPPGYRGPLPQDVLPFEEWSRRSQLFRKGATKNVQ